MPWPPGLRWRVAEPPAAPGQNDAGQTAAEPVDQPTQGQSHREILDYGLSLADLERVMPRLIPEATLTRKGRVYLLHWPEGGAVTLDPGQPRERSIAGLRIPWLQLTFDFVGLDAAARAAFLARFARCFQKGGG